MKVKELRDLLKNMDENTEIVVDNQLVEFHSNDWIGTSKQILFINQQMVNPKTGYIAKRPCLETSTCKKTLVIYVK